MLQSAALFGFENFKSVFSHPSVDLERTVSLVFLEKSALLMVCQSGRDTMAKV